MAIDLNTSTSPTLVGIAARIAHEANRAYCIAIGDDSQSKWEDVPDWQYLSCINGVQAVLSRGLTPRMLHENWLAHKQAGGWKWGSVKDPEKKEHPCMVTYDDLSLEQKIKDSLFVNIVNAVGQALAMRVITYRT
jgi:hypothetical protein